MLAGYILLGALLQLAAVKKRMINGIAALTLIFTLLFMLMWVVTVSYTHLDVYKRQTLDLENVPKTEEGKVDYSQDFFCKPTNLTVSGQLDAETYAFAFRNVYTFGPTFRAENSNTTRHAAEFWMIEPEMAFADLKDDICLLYTSWKVQELIK